MKLNWKLRVKNKVTLTAIIAGVLSLIYTVLGFFGIVPSVDGSVGKITKAEAKAYRK